MGGPSSSQSPRRSSWCSSTRVKTHQKNPMLVAQADDTAIQISGNEQEASDLIFTQGVVQSSRQSNYLAPSFTYSSGMGAKVTGVVDPATNTPKITITTPRIKQGGPGPDKNQDNWI